jgi:hypothetical protein
LSRFLRQGGGFDFPNRGTKVRIFMARGLPPDSTELRSIHALGTKALSGLPLSPLPDIQLLRTRPAPRNPESPRHFRADFRTNKTMVRILRRRIRSHARAHSFTDKRTGAHEALRRCSSRMQRDACALPRADCYGSRDITISMSGARPSASRSCVTYTAIP